MSLAAKVGDYSSVRRPANATALGRAATFYEFGGLGRGIFQSTAGVSGSRRFRLSRYEYSSGVKARVQIVARGSDAVWRSPRVAEFVLPDILILETAKEALDDAVLLL